MYVYVKIRRHSHTRIHAYTGPRQARALACRRHHNYEYVYAPVRVPPILFTYIH